ncbi:MAG: hypothetical protein Q4D54_08385, partial [Eubacteriales bacterium]|nr:hypothetical protein [Eubacteriales bacterium]
TEATTETTTEAVSGNLSITVTSGMGSESVAAMLQSAGIIDDALSFDNFLIEKGYATKLEVGTFYFSDNMSFEEIAQILMK